MYVYVIHAHGYMYIVYCTLIITYTVHTVHEIVIKNAALIICIIYNTCSIKKYQKA